jgi:hypothetical protein
MRGRKSRLESRADEIRTRLIVWRQTPESMRPSLRALARELSTSHSLLQHYLDGLERWKCEQGYRKARRLIGEIRAQAQAESRPLTEWEEQQVDSLDRTAIRHFVGTGLFKRLEKFRKEARRQGFLDTVQVRMLKSMSRLPGAKELLAKYPHRKVQPEPPTLEMKVGKLTIELDALGGFLWYEGGQVLCFAPKDNARSREVLAKLYEHRGEVKRQAQRFIERLMSEGRYEQIRAEICQQVPLEKLKPLDAFGDEAENHGNSAKHAGDAAHGHS